MKKATHLFERLRWRDPVTGTPLEPVVVARVPSGVPLSGALRIEGTRTGYPIVDGVARMTPALAQRHRAWLSLLDLSPPVEPGPASFQPEATVDSFGFQWAFNRSMRSSADLSWRVARRFGLSGEELGGRLALDAGAGAGDQSAYLLDRGAEVVSLDLSAAIDVTAAKLRLRPGWVGVQGDVTALPFGDGQFGLVYCEGVIQHTRDSALTVRELCRVLSPGGLALATHYGLPRRFLGKLRHAYLEPVRDRLSKVERYHLLLATGNLAALALLPGIGRLVRASGLAAWSELMPDFRTTWTNTFDWFGTHSYQRHVSAEEFWSYFERVGGIERVFQDGLVIAARRREPARSEPG